MYSDAPARAGRFNPSRREFAEIPCHTGFPIDYAG